MIDSFLNGCRSSALKIPAHSLLGFTPGADLKMELNPRFTQTHVLLFGSLFWGWLVTRLARSRSPEDSAAAPDWFRGSGLSTVPTLQRSWAAWRSSLPLRPLMNEDLTGAPEICRDQAKASLAFSSACSCLNALQLSH